MADLELLKAIMVTAEIYGKNFSPAAAAVFAEDLSDFPTPALIAAIARCRRELRGFPTVADILARVEDGRPGPEEAWAMLPRDEASSVVWTDEMREAHSAVRRQMAEDLVSARMAFREVYLKLLAEARARRKPVRWTPSLGHNKSTHAPAIREAVEKGRLSRDYAEKLLPDLSQPEEQLQITGAVEPELTQFNPVEMIAKLKKQIQEGGKS